MELYIKTLFSNTSIKIKIEQNTIIKFIIFFFIIDYMIKYIIIVRRFMKKILKENLLFILIIL